MRYKERMNFKVQPKLNDASRSRFALNFSGTLSARIGETIQPGGNQTKGKTV
jgi:hypothetical protein